MNELTDREKELLKWINFLLHVVNRYSIFLALINRDVDWLGEAMDKMGLKSKQEEMVEVLIEKYDMPITLTTNVKTLDDMEEMAKKRIKDE
jgi:hypothetical protein